MSAFTRREFDELFPDRTLTSRHTITGQDAARLKVTIEDGWQADTCYLCGHKDAEHACESCDQPVCLLCSTPDEDAGTRLCHECMTVTS